MTSGLSVLIPVYNWDVSELVDSLLAQRDHWPGPVEILLFDDGSAEEIRARNRPLGARPGVRYHELAANVGRAAIRNQLAAAAGHAWLLLLDNDSLLPDARFLARYAAARAGAPVLVGGTCYAPRPPAEPALYLRWLYGQAREARPAATRQRAPHAQLTVNNALVRADVLARIPFDEQLRGYGHEDTAWGDALARGGIAVRHLGNPVQHAGLEPAPDFLVKSEQAVHALAHLYRAGSPGMDSRLLQLALRLRRWGVAAGVAAALGAAEPRLRRHLLSARPRLRVLDALKLCWLLKQL